MEALAKMFFGFLAKDPQMRAGVFQAIDFITRLDERMRARDKAIFDRLKAIEERLGMPPGEAYIHPALNANDLPQLPAGPNGQAHQ